MARKVFISSSMSSDEEVSEIAEASPLAALMWPWMLTYFDDWGRAKASPREIKNGVFQANEAVTIDEIKKALQLYNGKLISLYEVSGKWYMAVPSDKWFKFQTHIRSSKRENDGSKIPPPPDGDNAHLREYAREVAEGSGDSRIYTPSPSLSPSPSPSKDSTTTAVGEENMFKVYEQEKFGFITSAIRDELIVLSEETSEKWVIEALKEASVNGKRTIPYTKAILRDWKLLNHPEPWMVPKQEKGGNRDGRHGTNRGNAENPYAGIDLGF